MDQQRAIESCTGVVEYPVKSHSSAQVRIQSRPAAFSEGPGGGGWVGCVSPHLKKEATSIISGMSKEKPALDLFRCIEKAWSLYERMGDMIRKIGAQKPATDASHCIVKMTDRRVSGKGAGVATESKMGR